MRLAPGDGGQLCVHTRATISNVAFKLRPELLQEGQGGHRRSLPEGANRVAHDAVRGVVQAVELLDRRLAVENLFAYSLEPAAPLAARRALSARLVTVKLHQVLHAPHRVRALGNDRYTAGAQHGTNAAHRIHSE